MRQACPSHGSRRGGFTLVELLLAVALASVVAALAWSLLSSTTRAVEREADRARGPDAAARAVELVRDDLERMFLPPGDPACALELAAGGDAPPRLAFCAVHVAARTADLAMGEPYRVEYTLAPEGGAGAAALLRISERLSGEMERETNVVLRPCSAFRVELGAGGTWQAKWPHETAGGAPPRAARVTVQARADDPPADAEFWIPAGHSLTSRFVRAGQAASAE